MLSRFTQGERYAGPTHQGLHNTEPSTSNHSPRAQHPAHEQRRTRCVNFRCPCQ